MTHEQKPESAAFRTREAQISSLAFHLHENTCDVCWSIAGIMAEKNVLEAEARGAAEQRRKDAERADLLGYVTQTGEDGLRHPYAADAFMRGVLNRKMDKFNTPVYTRPANVAALEDRVKELEAEKHANEGAAFERGFQGGRRDRYKQYERDTAKAVAAERERCAKLCEEIAPEDLWQRMFNCGEKAIRDTYEARVKEAAAAIRKTGGEQL